MENINNNQSTDNTLVRYLESAMSIVFNTKPREALIAIKALLRQVNREIEAGKKIEHDVVKMLNLLQERLEKHITMDEESDKLIFPLKNVTLEDLNNYDFVECIKEANPDDESYASIIYSLIDDINSKADEYLRHKERESMESAKEAKQIAKRLNEILTALLEWRKVPVQPEKPKQAVLK